MRFPIAALVAACATLAACGGGGGNDNDSKVNDKPSFIPGAITITSHTTGDDLLTAGLGWDGLKAATPPAFANAAAPTAAELRQRAIYTNYRALVDMSTAGGYGSLFGPNVSLTGTIDTTPGAGKITGLEYIAYSDDGTGKRNVTLMVQIPAGFDIKQPCIVTATSSGSRGVYGAVSAAGEWGLKRNCAIAYADKGTGNGGHELSTDRVTLIDGTLATSTAAGTTSQFTAQPATGTTIAAYNAAFPNRYAMKHAHSQQNPEKDWGLFTLQAIQFAFYAINDQYGQIAGSSRIATFQPDNTIVIAASVSNGGGAALAAAEQDTDKLIDGVVVGEPQINMTIPAGLLIRRNGVAVGAFGKPLYDYITLAALYQPCAAWAPSNSASPLLATSVPIAGAQAECARLAAAGLVTGTTFADQATSALQTLHDSGWEADSDLFQATHWAFATTSVALTYANAYSRASVTENLCNYSFATTDANGHPAAPASSPMTNLFAVGNGVPPTNGINIVYNAATGGAVNYLLANGDFAFDGVACMRALLTGTDALSTRLQTGLGEIKVTANLHGKPAILVQGRSDTLVPINHASRAYLLTNYSLEGASSKVSLLEVQNAQHFDSFLAFPGYDTRLVPLHVYNLRALDAMWNYLVNKTPLPPSQVIRTVPRGGTPGAAPALTSANLPAIQSTPGAADAIVLTPTTLDIPN